MAVFKNKRSGRWVAQAYDPKTQRPRQVGTFDTKREADKAYREHLRAQENAAGQSILTIAEWREQWLDTPKWRPSTRSHNEERTRRFVAAHGPLPIAAFTPGAAQRWAVEHPSSIEPLSAMFGAATNHVGDDDQRLIPSNPFSGVVSRSVKKRDIPDDWLTLADVERIERAAFELYPDDFGRDMAAMIRFAAETGIRPGELYTLEEADLNTDAGELTVRRAADSKTRIVGPPKNGEQRVIVLSNAAAQAAARARRFNGTSGTNPIVVDELTGRVQPWSSRGTQRLFSTARGRQWWTGPWGYYWRPTAIHAARVGMDFYELRHFCATRLLEAGVPDWQVAVQLGHQDGGELVRTTYGHPSRRQARAAVRAALDGEDERAA